MKHVKFGKGLGGQVAFTQTRKNNKIQEDKTV